MDVYSLEKAEAIANADSYGIMGIMMDAMEFKYAPDRDHPKDGVFKEYKDIPDRVRPSKRSAASEDWLQGKLNTVLSCEDVQNATKSGLHCRSFKA